MPIVVLLDVSLSMCRPVPGPQEPNRSPLTRASLAAAGINTFLDHLAANSRLEFVSLIVFSSQYDVVCNFTREYDIIRQKLRTLEDYDKTCFDTALMGAYNLVVTEWGTQTHVHIVLVTDGCASTEVTNMAQCPFPCTLHVLCVATSNDSSLPTSTPIYRTLIDAVGSNRGAPQGTLHTMEQPLSIASVNTMFRKFCNEQLAPWRGLMRCGALEARIVLTPAPLPHLHVTDFDSVKLQISTNLEICGFIAMQDIGSPMALSRHLVLPTNSPTQTSKNMNFSKGDSEQPNSPEEEISDSSKVPNFCVLLHGALKVENMAGLVQLGEDWYGLIHSWADSKKKSNLMLSVLPPGDDAIPWLGSIAQLGLAEFTDISDESFPVRVAERKSYSSGGSGANSTWVNPASLQTDLHKLLRHARKLPDKIHHFYKEVNRVRRAALALGWVEALEAAASLLERELAVLPPAAIIPLTLAVQHLRNMTDLKTQLPLTLNT